MLYLVALLLLGIWSHPTQASDEFPCDYAGTQRNLNACAIAEYREAFSEYANTYRRVMASMIPKEQVLTKSKSDAWARATYLQCQRVSSNSGSDETILFYSCLQQLTELRTLKLRARQTQP